MVFTGYTVNNDQKLPAKQRLLKKSPERYDSNLEMAGPDGKPAAWEEDSLQKDPLT